MMATQKECRPNRDVGDKSSILYRHRQGPLFLRRRTLGSLTWRRPSECAVPSALLSEVRFPPFTVWPHKLYF